MSEPIFLVVPGREAEGWDRRYTEFIFDEDDNIGYFTSHEAAEAWVTEQQSEGNAAYQKALKNYPRQVKAFETAKRNHDIKEDDIVARARDAGVPYSRKSFYRAVPKKPVLSHYVTTEYEIWEVWPHGS